MAEARSSGKKGKKSPGRQGKGQRQPAAAGMKPRPYWGRAMRSLFTCRRRHRADGGERECGKPGRCSGSPCGSRERCVAPEAPKERAGGRGRGGGGGAHEGGSAVASSSHSSLSSASLAGSGSSSSSASGGGSFRGLGRLSGCYECRTVVDPVNGGVARDASLRRTVSPCPDCGEIFARAESMELHRAVSHAVMELGPEDTSRNIVEIIFKSSWLRKQAPACKIDRILKVNSTPKTVSRFEEYRDSVRSKARKHPRCAADGNELLRFHAAPLACSLGAGGSTNLCRSAPPCGVCSVIRDGFRADELGAVRTTAAGGRAHGAARGPPGGEKGAVLVCRVIAGRVGEAARDDSAASADEYDSVAGSPSAGTAFSSTDELIVFDPRAILPCFVVIYGGF